MTKEAIIEKTIKTLNILPSENVWVIADFADFIMKKHNESTVQIGNYRLLPGSEAFSFLNDDEVLYSVKDIKKKY